MVVSSGVNGSGFPNVHQFCAVSTPSQRASVLRSSSVIWLKLLGGIAWLKTAC
jgi:hypothetical protein